MSTVRTFIAEFARKWADRRVKRVAEVSDVAHVSEAKRLPKRRPPAPYRPKSRPDIASHL